MAAKIGANSDGENGPKLSELFDKIWKSWEDAEKSDEPTSSDKYQKIVADGFATAERAIHMVNQLRLFSDNEHLEEVATNEIKYMLLSALLGYFQLKVTKDERITVVTSAKLYFVDFLRLCRNYEVKEINLPELDKEDQDDRSEEAENSAAPTHIRGPPRPDMATMNAQRQQKIAKFKEQKELERQLIELKSQVDKEHVDDDVKRNYYTTLLKKWINVSMDELVTIDDELQILRHMASMKRGNDSNARAASNKPEPPKQKLRPFILTKSTLQKQVYGAGYPSLPTYTIEEYFDQQMALGNVPGPSSSGGMDNGASGPHTEAEAEELKDTEKENQIENDDPEALAKARNWDDWKDTHRIGWGNTQNKG